MDEREELLKRDREKEKRREQRRLEREQELRKQMVMGAGVLGSGSGGGPDHQHYCGNKHFKEGKGGGCKRKKQNRKDWPLKKNRKKIR